ncbi:hypothetical protein [Ferrimonas balearica]|uniref:hypothetical protein n=1 Tax=Ferrimonas balearica TaxID=44012 RepID=UPI001C95E9F1|nr:hypothetical protein [Ferrimonas balearica]MBY5982254.1 hypothetical protein [Ferrimonas balearica]
MGVQLRLPVKTVQLRLVRSREENVMKYFMQILLIMILLGPNVACSSDFTVSDKADLTVEQVRKLIARASEHIVIDQSVELHAVGTLRNGIKAYSYVRVWNRGARASNRLIFVGVKGEYLGAYAVNDFPVRVEENCLYFSYHSEYGNSVCSKNSSLPQIVYLDGENLEIFR